jgi:poly-gamma-glutamate system protein
LSWRLDSRRKWILLGLAVAALLLQALLDNTRAPARQRDYALKLAAAEHAAEAFAVLREYRLRSGAHVDLVNDPAGTGLIGPEFSRITNARGDLESKLTSLNPNFAGLLVQYFREADLDQGDPVAVAISGSFPGINIGLFAALEAMKLRPVIITSIGASMWGANDPEFTWLDMERILDEQGVFHTRSALASYGGGDDMGRGLSPEGRDLIAAAAERNGVPLLVSANIDDAIAKRSAFFAEQSHGRRYRLYVNVGGGVASLGSSHNRLLMPHGLNFDLGLENVPRKGNLFLFAEQGVPVVHLINIVDLARNNGLPTVPDYLPLPGEGEIFVRESYRLPLAAAILAVYCGALVLILAPQIRKGLFDRLPRGRGRRTWGGIR